MRMDATLQTHSLSFLIHIVMFLRKIYKNWNMNLDEADFIGITFQYETILHLMWQYEEL